MEDNYYLELSEDEFIKFDPVSALTNVKLCFFLYISIITMSFTGFF